jgi:hypothetical protein
MMKVTSEQIREHVRKRYVDPARHAGKKQFSLRCGTVEKELGMSNRTNHVCSALKSRKFLEANGLRLVEASGPPSGVGITVEYTFEFQESAPMHEPKQTAIAPSIYGKLRQMEGMLTDVYRELGGAEKAIREEREGYSR